MPLGRPAGGDGLVGILVFQLFQRELAGLRDLDTARDRLRVVREEPGHLLRWLQMALGIGLQPVAGLDQGAALADAGGDILQGAPVGMVVERIRHRHHRRAEAFPEPGQPGRGGGARRHGSGG